MAKSDDLILDVLAGIEQRTEEKLRAVMMASAALGALELADGQEYIRFTVSTDKLTRMYETHNVTSEYDNTTQEWTVTLERKESKNA